MKAEKMVVEIEKTRKYVFEERSKMKTLKK